MSLLLIILSPVVLVIGYALCRLAVGRPLQRHTVDVLFALLLLGYFAGTAGLGIFWVANQELPVFDVHYLCGYVALLLVSVHVVLNWRVLVAFVQRRTPQAYASDADQPQRSAVRVVGWIAAFALFGGVCFWLGHRQGVSRIEITMAKSPPTPVRSTDRPDAGGVRQPDDTRPAEGVAASSPASDPESGARQEPPAPSPARHQIVKSDGQERVLADYYHEKTKHSRRSLMEESPGFVTARQPEVFKRYPDAQRIDLPEPLRHAGLSVGATIEACRPLTPGFAAGAVTLSELSTMLFMTNGITSTLKYPGRTYYLRAAPSAGALYPTVTYVVARRVEGLSPGLYHYAVKDHKLHRLRADETLTKRLAALVPQGHFVEQAPVTFAFTSIYFRSSWKYRGRAYRYCCLDAGHLAVQADLAAAALGYRSHLIGRFDDRQVNALLAPDDREEGALLLLPIGKPAADAPTVAAQRAFVPRPQQLSGQAGALPLLMHGHTFFGATDQTVAAFPSRLPVDKRYAERPLVALPSDCAAGDDVFPTIIRRRSVRRWVEPGLTLDQLATVLYHAFGIHLEDDGAYPDPSVEDNHALNLYVVVNDVLGLDAGVYYYHRHEHALLRIRAGDFRRKAHAASIFQDVVGDCDAVLAMSIDRDRCGYPDADRGYRYAALDAGMLGGRVYLQATGLGLGCCGVGAFFDDEVSALIEVSAQQELVLYLVALGAKAGEHSR